jgi:hypothetical protein
MDVHGCHFLLKKEINLCKYLQVFIMMFRLSPFLVQIKVSCFMGRQRNRTLAEPMED